MAHITFDIPHDKEELMRRSDEHYYVKSIIGAKETQKKLKEAKQSLKDEGPEFITEYFDIYFSIVYNADSFSMEVLMQAYEDLHKATQDLNRNMGFIFEDKESLNDELKLKYLTILKMLLYSYASVVNLIETKNLIKKRQRVQLKTKGRKDLEFGSTAQLDKQGILVVMNYILQREINLFWDPPVVEEAFVNLAADICYKFLENPAIKQEREARTEIFNILGTLLKKYTHGVTFVVRIVQLIKTCEHLIHCVPEGIELLVSKFNCKGLVRDFVREITEWQADEKLQDAQGTKHCSAVLTEMAVLMPALMIPEVMYLNRYLAHESYTLRNSVLNVITEVILTVLSKPDLNEDELESRDDFLVILEEHIWDCSAYVRSKVIQHWMRLQKENVITVKLQVKVLEQITRLLMDKVALVRKSAINCVTSFLSHNSFGAQLELNSIVTQLKEKTAECQTLMAKLEDVHSAKIRKLEQEWKNREDDIKATIEANLDEETPEAESNITKRDFIELVQMYLLEGKYKEAFILCNSTGAQFDEWKAVREPAEKDEQVKLYLLLLRTTFFDLESRLNELAASINVTEGDIKKLEGLQKEITYLEEAAAFLKLIDGAIKPMTELLESVSMNDTQEAVQFFIAAYQFNIDNGHLGLMVMLNIMKRPEQERKDLIIEAFKTIFLTTDSKTLTEHTQIIVTRLIGLVRSVPFENLEDLKIVISNWVSSGVLDNSVIDILWQYFTKRMEVTNDQSLAALQLLILAGMGRKTIISRNITLVSTLAFGERGANDLLLLGTACKFLAIAGSERPHITDRDPPFKIKPVDSMWGSLLDILRDHFLKRTPYYNYAITYAVEFIYKVCSKPELVCENLIEMLMALLNQNSTGKHDHFVLIRCGHLLGEIAVKHLNFLDESTYKELKRRNYIREERKNAKKGKSRSVGRNYLNPMASHRLNSLNSNSSVLSARNSAVPADGSTIGEESTLEGAQADDADAEFILDVLENATVTGSAGLAKLAPLILTVCENHVIYDDPHLQGTSVIALLRFMLVSSKFCKQHIQLLFTILEKIPYPDVKVSILVVLADLLERFPNIIEPWTPHIYERLQDPNLEVRKASFYMLANMILRDMMLVKGQISMMALCTVDKEDVMKNMSQSFFTTLATRGNNLYNVMPDIFSHLCDETDLSEDDFRFILKFLFSLIDKSKQMENLVDRFCHKFTVTEEPYKCRNIAYSLSLIQYNEKGLRNLLANFPNYKEFMQNDDVYAIFKQILNTCNKSAKNEIKTLEHFPQTPKPYTLFSLYVSPTKLASSGDDQSNLNCLGWRNAITSEIQEQINAVFETKDGPTSANKSKFKKPKGRPVRKKARGRRVDDSDSD